ncbi:PP2C family protein-serine/threonine phosphatase [Tritonibacter litoralis]|uniref:PP2C family protein-serine/threonine phosphatase n=1 Tax=Tritonibacter litoralis TaxID=2662264 RepID=UPI001884B4BA|nr:PP2C family serine/threonine-protein phosphatase [Tritonibacter litoralis]
MADLVFDTATALSQGRRDRQEDAVVADFQTGCDHGFAVLADGMGGHAGGDIASKIVVTEIFAELKLRSGDPKALEQDVTAILRDAAEGANACLAEFVDSNPERNGMGATLLAPVFVGRKLFWISVGDSPLFLWRNGTLRRLNADHSMAARLAQAVAAGRINPETARSHPDRACVTSVLSGREIAEVDCPPAPLTLQAGDIIVAASDGVMSLETAALEQVLSRAAGQPAAQMAQHVLAEVAGLGRLDQDNLAFCLIRVLPPMAPVTRQGPRPAQQPAPRTHFRRRKTTLVASAHQQGGDFHFHSLSKRSQ